LHRILLKEMAVLALHYGRNPKEDILNAITALNIDDWLTVVEMCFLVTHLTVRRWNEGTREDRGITQGPDDAVEELNIRFRQAGFGYQFEAGQIVRVDSQYLHSEVVKPALTLLGDRRFAGAQEEFRSAHAHYRAGEYEDAIHDANRAFESTMKAICDIKGEGWEYQKGARASDLIKIVRRNGLLAEYLGQSFDQLISTLQSGLPRVRNEAGGHGQGAVPRRTPGYVAGYALHLVAAKVVLLVEALKETERK
jgi:AbiJ N-terminal domain 4